MDFHNPVFYLGLVDLLVAVRFSGWDARCHPAYTFTFSGIDFSFYPGGRVQP